MKEVKTSVLFSSADICQSDVEEARIKESVFLLYCVGKDDVQVEVEIMAPNLAKDILGLKVHLQVGLIEVLLEELPEIGDSIVVVDDKNGCSGKMSNRAARVIRIKPEGSAVGASLLFSR